MGRSASGIVCVLLVISIAVGCGSDGPEIARVEGTITMDDKPLPAAIVMFVPTGGRPSVSETDSNGKYVLEFSGGRKGAIPGINRVEINTARLAYEKDGKNFPAVRESVPAKYNRLTTLEFQVEPGKRNIADFAIKSGGKIIEE
ncbi:MAG: carboxypeptidase regulatory-like domain-containing protein [Pirellula sp.]